MPRVVLISFALLCASCHPKSQERRYPFHGKIVSVDLGSKTANIQNDKIEGWMESMTMEYPIPDGAKLQAGNAISATVVVTDLNYHLENIKSP